VWTGLREDYHSDFLARIEVMIRAAELEREE